MKKVSKLSALAIVAMLCVGVFLSSDTKAEMLDESQTDVSNAYTFSQYEGGAHEYAQSFKVDDGVWLYRVDFYYDPADSPQLGVYIDTDLNTSNGYVVSHTFDTSSWSVGWHTWDIRSLSGDKHISQGTTYYLILNALPIYTGSPKWYGSSSDAYSKGSIYWYNETGWHSLTTGDLSFKIYTDVNPVAQFSYTTSLLTVNVNASSSYTTDGDAITVYGWDWDGDGSYDTTGVTASHTYDVAGTYSITLRIIDEDGHTDTETKQVTVSNNDPPVANFSFSINGKTVTFTDESTDSDGSIVNWTWNFGDGNLSYEQNPQHQYADYGNYTVTLTVKDNAGATDSISKYVNITATQGGGWFTWKLPFSWFAIFAIIFILMIGIATSAFFLKPESIKALGYAPAAGTLLITVFIAIAIFMYYAGIAWYWIAADVFVVIIILYLVLRLLLIKKRKVVRRLL